MSDTNKCDIGIQKLKKRRIAWVSFDLTTSGL